MFDFVAEVDESGRHRLPSSPRRSVSASQASVVGATVSSTAPTTLGALATEHPGQGLEELAVRRCAIRRFGKDDRKTPPQERIARRLSSKLDGQRDEPGGLPGAGAGACDRSILLEERQEERALGWELPVDGALGEPRRLSDLIQRPRLQAAFGKQPQAGLNEEGASFAFAALTDDSHGYLGYAPVPNSQGQTA